MVYHFRGPDGPMPALMEQTADQDPFLWALLDLVDQLDLSGFERVYRADGSGGQPYDPRLMLVTVWWCYQRGTRSPSAIARDCQTQIPLRVLWGSVRTPSLSTVRRFIQQHARAWERINTEILRACERAGLIDVSITATDSTPVAAPAALAQNYSRIQLQLMIDDTEQALTGILDQVQHHGLNARTGDTDGFLDHGCGTLLHQEHQLRRRLTQLHTAVTIAERREQEHPTRSPPALALQRRIDKHREHLAAMIADQQQACDIYQAKTDAGNKPRGPAPRSPPEDSHIRAKHATLDKARKKLAALPPHTPTTNGGGGTRVNLTALHSRILKGKNTTTWVQGDLLTITVGARQIIIAAQLPGTGNDHGTLHPHLELVARNCHQAGITSPMTYHLADAGYGSETVFNTPTPTGGTLYIAVTNERDQISTKPPTTAPTPGRQQMTERLTTTHGAATYRRRTAMIEPVFAQILGNDRHLHTRGTAKHTEILALIAAHNATKYIRLTTPTTPKRVLANDLKQLTN